MDTLKLAIAGGGTGGHISPGVALYEELRSMDAEVLYIASKRDTRFETLDAIEEGDLLRYAGPQFTKNPIKLPLFIFRFATSVLKSLRYFRKRKITAVVGMGGYVSAPALAAAWISSRMIYLCEQNTVPGMVTRLFEKRAGAVFATFEKQQDYMKMPEKMVYTGNPTRVSTRTQISQAEARRSFNLSHVRHVVLIIGGSQGAASMNELVYKMKETYSSELRDVGFIWSTGSFSYEKYRDALNTSLNDGSIYLSPFISRVGDAYQAADIAISRSGAGVMMELAQAALPSILIPFPHAAMDHQRINAQVFADAGASFLLDQKSATPEILFTMLQELIYNGRKRSEMSDRARAASIPDAAKRVARYIEDDLKERG